MVNDIKFLSEYLDFWKKFLLEQSQIENSDIINMTHEDIAKHMGSAREVVTRMLKYFQNEGLVKTERGTA